MSKQQRKGSSSVSDEVGVAEIENVAQKVIDAAVSRLKDELTNVVEVATKEMKKELTNALCDFDNRLQSIENRLDILEHEDHEVPDFESVRRELGSIRAEVRESMVIANDAEQQTRSCNVRIRGLEVKGDSASKAVVEFIQQKLRVPEIQLQDIEQAHPVKTRVSTEAGANAASANAATSVNTESRGRPEPSVFVKFRQRYHRDLVLRQRRTLKGSRFTVVEDLTALNIKTLNRARNNEHINTTWTWNGKIYAITTDNRKLLIKPFQAVQDCNEV